MSESSTITASVPFAARFAAGLQDSDAPGLAALALRTRSDEVAEVLARAASSGQRGQADLLAALRNESGAGEPGNGVGDLRPEWALPLARVVALRVPEDGPDPVGALAIYTHVRQRHGPQAIDAASAGLYAQLLFSQGRHDELASVWDELAVDDGTRWSLEADRLNPHLGPTAPDTGEHGPELTDSDTERIDAETERAWLAAFSSVFGDLEPIALRPGDGTAFSRLGYSSPGEPVAGTTGGGLVSVIMPAYQPDRSIVTSVRSIIEQSWADLELLVVDDASPAEYAPLFDEVAAMDDRVQIIRAEENGGTYAARNIGFAAARGKYVTFQDADDWSHPRRLETQIRPFRKNKQLLATRGWAVRAFSDLALTFVGYSSSRLNASSLLFRREAVTRLVGRFDEARKSADMELPGRIRAAAPKSILDMADHPPLSITQLRPGSLSRADAVPGWTHWERLTYRDRYLEWHDRIRNGLASARLTQRSRPFPLPSPTWAPRKSEFTGKRRFDVVYLDDWRKGRGTGHVSANEATTLAATVGADVSVAVAEAEAMVPLAGKWQRASWALPRLLNTGMPYVHLSEDVAIGRLVVANPAILQTLSTRASHAQVDEVSVILDMPSRATSGDEVDLGFRIADCDRACERLFGVRPVWVPRGAAARALLAGEASGVRVAAQDLPDAAGPPLRSAGRHVPGHQPGHRLGDRPVLGHHLPNRPGSWPGDAATLRSAYPDRDDVDVRVLRAGATARSILGTPDVPPNWVAYDGLFMTSREFLRQLDYYVYFGADGRSDDAVRAAREALAAGCVAVLPEAFADDFGDAAVYATPDTAMKTIMTLHADADADNRQRDRGLVEARHSAETFTTRLLSPVVEQN